MTERPPRIVDTHVHLWDPARTDWYPYLAGSMDIGMGDTAGMARRFDVATYRAESPGWNVDKLVNVAAATFLHSIDETLEIGARADADGQPAALIGGIVATETAAEGIELIDRQMAVARFRGVRPMGRMPGPLPDADVLRALAERDLLFEILARPEQLEAAARGLEGHDDLTVVLEHTGWPQSRDDEERRVWRAGIEALAARPNVVCKLSGLSAPAGGMQASAFTPWLEPGLEAFGVGRCFFASNFPVDGLHGTLDELWSTFDEATASCTVAERDQLFATNADRTYRI